jgi:hypothetical protein
MKEGFYTNTGLMKQVSGLYLSVPQYLSFTENNRAYPYEYTIICNLV